MDIAVEFAHLTKERWYLCRAERENIKWHHIIDLNDWIQIGVEPGLMHGHQGPVGWIASGEHMPLQVAALVFGTPLTYTQMCSLVVHLGGELPKAKGKPSKVVVHKFLISMVVPEDLQAVAHTHVVEGQVVDDFDTDFSELLFELGQDDGNQQDLKEFRDKKKHHRMRKALGVKDEPLKPKAKGKAKAKAKVKGKAKGRPKAKASFAQKLMKDAARKMGEEAEPMDVVGQEGAQGTGMDLDVAAMLEPPHMLEPEASQPPEAPQPAMLEPNPSQPPEAPQPAMPEPEAPQSEASQPSRPDPSQPANPGPKASEAAPRAEKRKSPEEILVPLSPPGCRFGISYQDHRFTSHWKSDDHRFSRTFVTRMTWQQALVAVHKHNWERWADVSSDFPLQPGETAQVPGEIPQTIFEQLEPRMKTLPEVRRYSKK